MNNQQITSPLEIGLDVMHAVVLQCLFCHEAAYAIRADVPACDC